LPVAVRILGTEDDWDRAVGHDCGARRPRFRIVGRPIEQIAQGEIANGRINRIRFLQPREGIAFTRTSQHINALLKCAGCDTLNHHCPA
jgi:hypothetical protein